MAHFIARTVTENPAYMQALVKVPAGKELHAGHVVVAEELDATIAGNLQVYAPTQVADATKEEVAIILDGGIETLADGRRPDGQPDYTQYVLKSGEVVTAHRLIPETRYEVSMDACDETVAAGLVEVGGKLEPKNGQFELTYVAKSSAATAKNYLVIEALKYFRVGGQFGADFAETMVVRAKATDAIAE